MNTKLGPILTKTNVINFMTKIGLRLGMLVNTAPELINQYFITGHYIAARPLFFYLAEDMYVYNTLASH